MSTVLALALGLAAAAAPLDPDAALVARLKSVAASSSGVLGVRVVHVESGAGESLNGDTWFPMMSVYKLPIAIHALRLAEQGRLDLSEQITLATEDRRPGLSPLARRIEEHGPQSLTVKEMLSSIVRISDNTASDRLLRRAGGPAAVQATLRALGVRGITVDRYELEFAADYYGICCLAAMKPFSLERFAAQVEKQSSAVRQQAAARYLIDRRDVATPTGLATLMVRLVRGELLDAEHTQWLLGEMEQMHTRDTRLRAGFPKGTRMSLRPGTSGETAGIRAAHNDSAVVTLPDGRGHLVVVALLKGSKGTDEARDAVLASIGRAAYEWMRAER